MLTLFCWMSLPPISMLANKTLLLDVIDQLFIDKTLIIATHDPLVIDRMDRRIELQQGRLVL